MRNKIAEIRLSAGQVGFYDDLTNIHLTLTRPIADVYQGMNTSRLQQSVNSGRLLLTWGSLRPAPVNLSIETPVETPVVAAAKTKAVVQAEEVAPVVLESEVPEVAEVAIEAVAEEAPVEVVEEEAVEEVVVEEAKPKKRSSKK